MNDLILFVTLPCCAMIVIVGISIYFRLVKKLTTLPPYADVTQVPAGSNKKLIRSLRKVEKDVQALTLWTQSSSTSQEPWFKALQESIAATLSRQTGLLLERMRQDCGDLNREILSLCKATERDLGKATESWTGELALISEKLDRLGAGEMPLVESPLKQWTFGDYRKVLDKFNGAVTQIIEQHDRNVPIRLRLAESAAELTLIADLTEIGEKVATVADVGVPAGAEAVEWVASAAPPIALLVPKVLAVSAAAVHYLPIAMAIFHYLEVRHVKAQFKELRKDASYLIDVRDSDDEAVIQAHWSFARELLDVPNLTTARMGLREVCHALVALRHSHIAKTVRLFDNASQPVDGKSFSSIWMNRCLGVIDRLFDAVLLEFYIRIALQDTERFFDHVVPIEAVSVELALGKCHEIVQRRIDHKGLLERKDVALPLRSVPMRLKSYGKMLELVSRSKGQDVLSTLNRTAAPE